MTATNEIRVEIENLSFIIDVVNICLEGDYYSCYSFYYSLECASIFVV